MVWAGSLSKPAHTSVPTCDAKGTKLLVAGDDGLLERVFGQPPAEGTIDLPGVMSRKKQVAPKLMAAL